MDAAAAREELSNARQALFCEPDDQSTWWFSFDVLRRSNHATVDEEVAALEELRSLEPMLVGRKWRCSDCARARRARRRGGGRGVARRAREIGPDHAVGCTELPMFFGASSSRGQTPFVVYPHRPFTDYCESASSRGTFSSASAGGFSGRPPKQLTSPPPSSKRVRHGKTNAKSMNGP